MENQNSYLLMLLAVLLMTVSLNNRREANRELEPAKEVTSTVGTQEQATESNITVDGFDSVVTDKRVIRRRKSSHYINGTLYRGDKYTVNIIECFGGLDNPGVKFYVDDETYEYLGVGDPVRLNIVRENGKLIDIKLLESDGDFRSCVNRIESGDV